MSGARDYDVAVFGATGFTGARVLRYACKSQPSWRIAAAGRSNDKLQAAAEAFEAPRAKIVAGVNITDASSLLQLAQASKLVLNCVGPYRHYGEPVVKACVEAGTDYVDVCGEPEFMEAMQLKYGAGAAASGCFIVSAAGFDCVPAELGAAKCCAALQAKQLTPHRVVSRLTLEWGPAGASAHYATYESAVHGFGSTRHLASTRKQARAQGLNKPAPVPGPKPRKPPACEWRPAWAAWALPFPGADASVVRRSMSARAARGHPVSHYLAFFTISSRLNLSLFLLIGGALSTLARFAWGRAMLLKFPGAFTLGAFSKAGPSEEQMAGTSFVMVHEGYGAADLSSAPKVPAVRVSIAGPEPGYIATPIFAVEAAAELLASRSAIAEAVGAAGGVCTPGQAMLMHGDGYEKRLQAAGIKVRVDELQ